MKKISLSMIAILFYGSLAWGQSRCLTPEFEQARLALYDSYGGANPHHNPALPSTSDIATHVVGDTVRFWSWDLTVQPPVWERVLATCREVTANAYIFITNDQWNVHMDSADVAQAAYYWEQGTYIDSTAGIYQLDTESFGQPPDELDNDPHIYILYDALGSYNGTIFDGYFSVFNEYTEEQANGMGGHSNECEMFYMSCYPNDPVGPIRISVLAHEFEHMIHWAHDSDEATWVDEGCAEYAMVLFGVPDPIVDFPNQPDNNLTLWSNAFADYVQTLLFFTYVSDHFGGYETLAAIVADPQNSIDGIESALTNRGYDILFPDLYMDWTMANFYHGAGGADLPHPDSQFIYFSLDPPAFRTIDNIQTYPAGPYNRSVAHWATDYVRFNNSGGIYSQLMPSFSGVTSTDWGLALFPISTEIRAERVFPESGIWQDTISEFQNNTSIVMAVAGISSAGATNYIYQANALTGIDDDPPVADGFDISLYPNPANQNFLIRYSKPSGEDAQIDIFDIQGRLIRTLSVGPESSAGEIIWDGRNANSRAIASGVYFFRLITTSNSKVVRGVMLK
jgi:hypothetical protein